MPSNKSGLDIIPYIRYVHHMKHVFENRVAITVYLEREHRDALLADAKAHAMLFSEYVRGLLGATDEKEAGEHREASPAVKVKARRHLGAAQSEVSVPDNRSSAGVGEGEPGVAIDGIGGDGETQPHGTPKRKGRDVTPCIHGSHPFLCRYEECRRKA